MLTDTYIMLRPLQHTDKAALARLADNRNIWNNVRDYLPHPYTEQDAEAFISQTSQKTQPVTFAIAVGGEFCGVIGLVPQDDVYRKSAEIGYWVGEPFWGQGVATAAVRLIADYGFGQLELVRLYAGI